VYFVPLFFLKYRGKEQNHYGIYELGWLKTDAEDANPSSRSPSRHTPNQNKNNCPKADKIEKLRVICNSPIIKIYNNANENNTNRKSNKLLYDKIE
jgi:hypothetical protein